VQKNAEIAAAKPKTGWFSRFPGGGSVKKSPVKWVSTGKEVNVGKKTKAVYANAATGELRVRKVTTLPDGGRKTSYVKFE
jgi:hypothetical protein